MNDWLPPAGAAARLGLRQCLGPAWPGHLQPAEACHAVHEEGVGEGGEVEHQAGMATQGAGLATRHIPAVALRTCERKLGRDTNNQVNFSISYLAQCGVQTDMPVARVVNIREMNLYVFASQCPNSWTKRNLDCTTQ